MEVYGNSSLSFDHLTDREFEEVVEWYFKLEIQSGKFLDHDKTDLLPEGADEGRDIMLLKEGSITGAVQCKKLNKNITNAEIFSELVKFIMFHLKNQDNNKLSSSHIDNINTFTYYFVSAKGFSKNTFPLVHDFKNVWRKQEFNLDIKKVFEKHKNAFLAFNGMDFSLNQVRIESILDNLSFQVVKPHEIDPVIRLSEEVINRYFQADLRSSLIQKAKEKNKFYKVKANRISSRLDHSKKHFGINKASVIKRKEVDKIITWIKSPLEKNGNNLAVLSANAGMGKTVAMSQLQNQLRAELIPSYSLKADYFNYKSIVDFKQELSIDDSFADFTLSVKGDSDLVVVIIDQLDALSQTLSADQSALKTYATIIEELEEHKNVRIVLSCREYDLLNDPLLTYYSKKKIFNLLPLDENEIKQVLESQLSATFILKKSLKKLLSTPLHLDIFLSIYSKDLDLKKLTSLQDLYAKFWTEKVSITKKGKLDGIDLKNVDKAIFGIADKMSDSQEIVVSKSPFEDSFYNELNYLESTGIVKSSYSKIEFFHQSFFDYAFARNFINTEKDLLNEIVQNHQGLLVRSKIKQIVDYKRTTSAKKYLIDLDKILFSPDVRFHIELMILQQLVFRNDPTVGEKKMLQKIFECELASIDLLFRLHYSSNWLQFFFQEKIIESFWQENNEERIWSISLFLRRFEKDFSHEIVEFLWANRRLVQFHKVCLDVMKRCETFTHPLHFKLRDYLLDGKFNEMDSYYEHKLIKGSILNDPDGAIHLLLSANLTNLKKKISDRKEYLVAESMFPDIYSLLREHHPQKTYHLIKKIIVKLSGEKLLDYPSLRILKVDPTFESFIPSTEGRNAPVHFQQYENLMVHLSKQEDFEFVLGEVEYYLKSNNSSLFLIGLFVISESPTNFIQESFCVLSNKQLLLDLCIRGKYFPYLAYVLLNKSFGLFDIKQKKIISDIIGKFYLLEARRLYVNDEGKLQLFKNYHRLRYKLLSSIPTDERESIHELRTSYHEFRRLYGIISLLQVPKKSSILSSGEKPLPDRSYDTMNLVDWKRTIKRFSSTHPNYDEWSDIAREHSHSDKFETAISLDHEKYLPLIPEIINESEVTNIYKLSAIKGLINGKYETPKLIDLFLEFYNKNDLTPSTVSQLIWYTKEFAIQKVQDKRIIDFLVTIALEKTEDEKEKRKVRGYALEYLMNFAYSDENVELIFSTIEKALGLNDVEKGLVLANLKFLLRYDKERVIKIFLNFTSELSNDSLEYSIRILQHMKTSDINEITPFFNMIITNETRINGFGQFLVKAYCHGEQLAEPLLNEYCEQGAEQVVDCLNMAYKFIDENVQVEKALTVLSKFLQSDQEDIIRVYANSFHHFDSKQFKELEHFIQAYIKTNVGRYRGYQFYQFLHKCSYNYPVECINLVMQHSSHFAPDIFDRYLKNEPLKVIMNAYRVLRKTELADDQLDFAMDNLDSILKEPSYFESGEEVLGENTV